MPHQELYVDDRLWDGNMCGNPDEDESEILETPCCTTETNIDKKEGDEMLEESNSWLPWFHHEETTKNIELHVCCHLGYPQDGAPLVIYTFTNK